MARTSRSRVTLPKIKALFKFISLRGSDTNILIHANNTNLRIGIISTFVYWYRYSYSLKISSNFLSISSMGETSFLAFEVNTSVFSVLVFTAISGFLVLRVFIILAGCLTIKKCRKMFVFCSSITFNALISLSLGIKSLYYSASFRGAFKFVRCTLCYNTYLTEVAAT